MSPRIRNGLLLAVLTAGILLCGVFAAASFVDQKGFEWIVNGDNVRTYPDPVPAPRNPPVTDDGRPGD